MPTRRSPRVDEDFAPDATDDLPADYSVERNAQGFDEVDPMADTSSMAAVVDPTLWDPVPVTLPTYVTKPAAAAPHGPHHRLRRARRVDLGPHRYRLADRPRGRRGRQGRAPRGDDDRAAAVGS